MCGRYTLSTPIEALEQRFHATLPRAALTPTYNAAPSQALPVICNTHSQEITMSAWGFVPEWADGRTGVKPLINARAETVATKPTFRQAFRGKRCLILTDGFYEWKRAGKSKAPQRPSCAAPRNCRPWRGRHSRRKRPRSRTMVCLPLWRS